jgi:hypothetical protein
MPHNRRIWETSPQAEAVRAAEARAGTLRLAAGQHLTGVAPIPRRVGHRDGAIAAVAAVAAREDHAAAGAEGAAALEAGRRAESLANPGAVGQAGEGEGAAAEVARLVQRPTAAVGLAGAAGRLDGLGVGDRLAGPPAITAAVHPLDVFAASASGQ